MRDRLPHEYAHVDVIAELRAARLTGEGVTPKSRRAICDRIANSVEGLAAAGLVLAIFTNEEAESLGQVGERLRERTARTYPR